MMGTTFKRLLGALLVSVACILPAAEINADAQYYAVTLEVPDRSERERSRALSQALQIALRRLTGQLDVSTAPGIRDALRSADDYALRFGYERLAEGGSALRVQFDPRGMRRLIEAAGLKVWSLERPRLMAWVLIEDDRGERILDAASLGEIPDAMRLSAAEYGLPLVLPLMDIEERLQVRPMHLRGLFFNDLRGASRRYRSEFILVGRIKALEDGVWAGSWVLAQPGVALVEREYSGDGSEIARSAMGFVLGELSSRFALATGVETRVRISVEGVRDLADYAELFDYLAQLDGVQRALLHEVTAGLITLDVWLATSWEGFLDLLSHQRRLSPVFVVDLDEGEQRMVWREQ